MSWIGIVLVISSLVGVAFAVERYFAKNADFQELASSYQFDKLTQRHNAVQERLWALENLCHNTPSQCSTQVRAEIQHLRLELEELKREMAKKG